MSAADLLKQKNGLKTTQSVLQKQQSGQDAAQKQMPVFTQSQLNAAGKKIDEQNAAIPKDETPSMKEARLRTIANQKGAENGINMNGGVEKDEEDKPSIPIVKKSEPNKEVAPGTESRGMSYADIFKMINPEDKAKNEKDEKRERTRMRIAAIGDGLRALSNIYFATKGAKVIHNPVQDLTGTMLKRKQMLDAQREKNRSAWISGYQRALALDEEARKNDRTISEQIRHNKELEAVAKQKANQGDTRLEQSQQKIEQGQQKIQLTADSINERARHNKAMEQVAQQNADSRSVSARSGGKRAKARTAAQKQWCMDKVIQYANQSEENAAKVVKAVASVGGKQLTPNTAEGVYNAVVAGSKQPSKSAPKKSVGKPAVKTSAKSKFSIHK